MSVNICSVVFYLTYFFSWLVILNQNYRNVLVLFPLVVFIFTANPFQTGVPAMRTWVPCNQNRFFHAWKTSQGKICSGPVLALYRIAVLLTFLVCNYWCKIKTKEFLFLYESIYAMAIDKFLYLFIFFPWNRHAHSSARNSFTEKKFNFVVVWILACYLQFRFRRVAYAHTLYKNWSF